MIAFRDRMARGETRTGLIESRHSFSFGRYDDPQHRHFRALRVLNEDRLIPGAGFAPHDHLDMEILTWVLDGCVLHEDSLGNRAVIRAGELQRITAGTGIRHAERNADAAAPTRLLQIWIIPARRGLAPGYAQRAFPAAERQDRLRLIAGPAGPAQAAAGALMLEQDARLYAATLDAGTGVTHKLAAGRGAWLQVARGIVALDGTEMREGDGAGVTDEPSLRIEAETDAEMLLIDLP